RQPTRPTVVIATASQSPLCVERLANVAAAEPLILPCMDQLVNEQGEVCPPLFRQEDGVPQGKGAPAVQPEGEAQPPSFGDAHVVVAQRRFAQHSGDCLPLLWRQRQ